MKVRRAVLNGVSYPHVPLEPLVQIASLRNVDRDPSPIFGLSGIDVVSWQSLKRSLQRENLVGILLSGLTRPPNQIRRGCLLRVPVTTE